MPSYWTPSRLSCTTLLSFIRTWCFPSWRMLTLIGRWLVVSFPDRSCFRPKVLTLPRCRWLSLLRAIIASVRTFLSWNYEKKQPCDVVNKKGSNRASVVRTCNRPEVLLSGSIPDLELDDLLTDFDGLGGELNSDGDIVVCVHFLLDELEDWARFSDAFY